VDISPRMLAFAEKQKNRRGIRNLEFVYGDSTRLGEYLDRHYDLAVTSLSLHEMGPDERHATVCSMSSVADRLILADHATPQPATIPGFFITQMERLIAGRLNWEVYREFVASGGVLGALERCGLSPDGQHRDGMGIRHVVTAAVDNIP
jgi:SAM-dependent methyltransferase